jgi:hypothetical protein
VQEISLKFVCRTVFQGYAVHRSAFMRIKKHPGLVTIETLPQVEGNFLDCIDV